MRFRLDNIIGKNSYPGKKSEDLSEKKEKEELAFNNAESKSDYNKIKIVESKNAVHPENRYNSVEEEEKVVEPEKSFKTAEDVIDTDNTEDRLMDAIDANIAEEREMRIEEDEKNDYGFSEITNKLVAIAKSKGDQTAAKNIAIRMKSFKADYQALLAKNLPLEQEAKQVTELFQAHLGNVVYAGSQMELVNLEDTLVKNARKNRRHSGEVIFADNKNKATSEVKPEAKVAPLPFKKASEVAASHEDKQRSSARFTVKKKDNNKYSASNLLRKIKINW
jgi:hypothetical protein